MVDDPTTVAELATLAPEIVEQGILPSANALQVIGPVVRTPRSFRNVTGPGDTFRFQQSDTLTMAALSVAGADNDTVDWIPTERQLLPVLLGTQVSLPLQGTMASQGDPVEYLQTEIGAALATLNDSSTTTSFAALYTEAPASTPDHEHGVDGTALDHTAARHIYQLLITAGAQPPFNWFIDPVQWAELMQDSTAQALLRDNGTLPVGQRATDGPRLDMYVGRMFGVDIWCVPTGMIQANGPFSMAVGQNAVGMVWKDISTPLSPTPSPVNVDIHWDAQDRNWIVAITVCQDIGGIAFTSTTNKWMVAYVS